MYDEQVNILLKSKFYIIFFCCLLHRFAFTSWGILSGAVFCLGITLQIAVTFPAVGIAVGSGIQSSAAVITSLFWTADVLHESMRSSFGTLCGVLVVVLGMNMIIFTGRIFGTLGIKFEPDGADEVPTERTPLLHVEMPLTTTPPSSSSSPPPETECPPPDSANNGNNNVDEDDDEDENSTATFARGAGVAMLAGICQGTFLVPAEEVTSAASGVAYLPSMGIGVAVATVPCVALTIWLAPRSQGGYNGSANDKKKDEEGGAANPSAESSSVMGAITRALLLPLAVAKETMPWTLLGGGLNVLAIACIITVSFGVLLVMSFA